MDDKSKQGYQDDSKIARDEVSYWAKKWKVTTQDIINAIATTESNAVSVIEKYLKKIKSKP